MIEPPVVRPWWREPWPWLLMAGPLLTAVGCVVTIALAVRDFSDQPIDDGAVRAGLVVRAPAAQAGLAGQPQSPQAHGQQP